MCFEELINKTKIESADEQCGSFNIKNGVNQNYCSSKQK